MSALFRSSFLDAHIAKSRPALQGVSSNMVEFQESRTLRGKQPFHADGNSVLLFIDLSGSTRQCCVRETYDRVLSEVIEEECGRTGVSSVMYVFWGTELFITDDRKTAAEIYRCLNAYGTSASLLVNATRSIPGVEDARVVIVTDGDVPSHEIRSCEHHRFREVYFMCVELRPNSTDRSLPLIFDNSASLSIEYVDTVHDTRDVVLRDYDGTKADDIVEDFCKKVDDVREHTDRTGYPPVHDLHFAPLNDAVGALCMATFDRPDRFHAVRHEVSAVMRLMKDHRNKRQEARVVERLADLRGDLANEAFDDAVKFLQDLLSKLGSSVTSTGFTHRADLKAPGLMERSGVDTEDTTDKAASPYDSAYLEPCPITGGEHLIPLAPLPADLADNEMFVREPLAFLRALTEKGGIVMPLMSRQTYKEWVVTRGNDTHPTTRNKIGGVLPLYSRVGPDEVKVLRSQIAHAFFGGKMTGPWSRFLAAIYLATKSCSFVQPEAVDALLGMTRQALLKNTGPVTGTPLVSFPGARSNVLLSFQYKLLSKRLGFRGESDVFRSVLMFPGLARNILQLLRDVGRDAWDPEMLAVDELELERTIDAYESYVAMYRLYGKLGEKGLAKLMRTLWQAYEKLGGGDDDLESVVFFSGPGDDSLVRQYGIRCPPGLVHGLYTYLLEGMQRHRACLEGANIQDIKGAYLDCVRELPLPEPIVHEDEQDPHKQEAYKESMSLCTRTCRPYIPNTGVPFSRSEAEAKYGKHFLSLHNCYGVLVCSLGRFPTEDELLAFIAKRKCTQSGDDMAVLPRRELTRDVLRVIFSEFEELRDRDPALTDASEFGRRFHKSMYPWHRFDMQNSC